MLKKCHCHQTIYVSGVLYRYLYPALVCVKNKSFLTPHRTTRLSTFPDYLVIQLKKFTVREDWVPIKLDVAVEMPDLLDLAPLRGVGPQPGEEPLPELAGGAVPAPVIDEGVLSQLVDMGE